MLYVLELPEHIVVLPVMAPGCVMLPDIVTASVRDADAPQVLLAVTEMFPLVALATAVMELVVEVPVHPPGSVQV